MSANRVRDKWPREYAAEIIALRTKAERREALAKVPEHLRDWVWQLVMDRFERKQAARRVV